MNPLDGPQPLEELLAKPRRVPMEDWVAGLAGRTGRPLWPVTPSTAAEIGRRAAESRMANLRKVVTSVDPLAGTRWRLENGRLS